MKKLVLAAAAVAALSLSGCTLGTFSFFTKKEKVQEVAAPSNPAEKAYLVGRDHGLGMLCARQVPYTVLNEHKESARMLLSTFTIEWQRAAQWEYNRGVQDSAKLKPEEVDCSTAADHLIAQIACNYEDAGINLKKDTIFK